MVEVPIKRAMIEAAETVALLADSAKFSMAGMVWVTDARALDTIVTDAPVPDSCDAAAERFGVEVTVV
jgi:DeoR/GlpR family transcriptional regulator of sugar metabolism